MTDTQHGGAAVCCQPRTWHSLNPGEGVLSHKINVLLRSGWISLIEELASCAPELIFFFCFILCVKKKSLQEVTASRAWHVTVDARGLLKINSAWWTPSVPPELRASGVQSLGLYPHHRDLLGFISGFESECLLCGGEI